jgi:hypothetical protein
MNLGGAAAPPIPPFGTALARKLYTLGINYIINISLKTESFSFTLSNARQFYLPRES